MHILFLTDNFPPEGNAPATRTYEHAREWVQLGHDVTVITCAPNFPEGVLFDGYKNKWYQREEMEGIKVVRVKTYITANEGFVKRILDYISFGVTGGIAGFFQTRPDVVVSTSPQFFCACGAWVLSVIRGKPWVFELRDIWPASITAVGAMEKSTIIRMLEKLEMFLYRRADRIVSVTNSFKAELIERGIDGNKIDVVINGVDLSKYSPAATKDPALAEQYGLAGKFVVGYIGTHGMAHALDRVLDTAELLQDQKDIRVLFAGGGAERASLERQAEERGLGNVVMMPRQPKAMMPSVWSLCDISLISLRDTPLFTQVIPSKIFESMGMGLPMVIACPRGEAAEIIESTGSGVAVPAEDPASLAGCIGELYADRERLEALAKASGSSAEQYDRKRQAESMLDSLLKAASC
ncbi:glycosyltransferase family 4 protein [Candidatus Marimicrobium litorale]|uniref:Glycosyltransferase WbuB n=1 Tax=Candidatus Marimicrobium litorale TaxID=2518991 RepID=A0ABT3T557_9GAMM|nr:glycosyltransferase family 4 protein [Candidatus Marimicrobium litorale]MCX2977391.1 glycosyltransferase WbuB [Candidatus Marimicrobium litorale]